MENKADHALSLMIKFCLFEEDCFPVLKNHFGNDCYNSALSNYQSNYKRYVHRYVALSHIYHSLINCSSLFDMNVRLYLRKQIIVREEQLDRFSRAMHESFCSTAFHSICQTCWSINRWYPWRWQGPGFTPRQISWFNYQK